MCSSVPCLRPYGRAGAGASACRRFRPPPLGGAARSPTDGWSGRPTASVGWRRGRARSGSSAYPFPPWTRYVEAVVPVSLAIAVSIQHDALFPLALAGAVGAAAAAPSCSCSSSTGPPPSCCGGSAPSSCSGAVAALVLDPVPGDVAPFFLVHLVAITALVGSHWEGSIVFALSAGSWSGLSSPAVTTASFVWILGFLAVGGPVAWQFAHSSRSTPTSRRPSRRWPSRRWSPRSASASPARSTTSSRTPCR